MTGPPSETDDADPGTELTSARIAGAAYAGSGGKGGACDRSARLLAALRRDPLVVSAVGGSPGKALLVWNGDWVRDAMMWEVGFAPPERRAQPVHGLILFALGGGVKVVMGGGAVAVVGYAEKPGRRRRRGGQLAVGLSPRRSGG